LLLVLVADQWITIWRERSHRVPPCIKLLHNMKTVLVALLLSLPLVANAQSSSGAELRNSGTDYLRICVPSAQSQQNYAAACGIWLTGVVDGLQAYNSNTKVLPLFDAPDITVGQVSKLLVKYINDHPTYAKLPTAALVLGVLVENYPRKEPASSPKP